MKKIYTLFLLLCSLSAMTQSETEPNDDFTTANSMNRNAVRTGTVNNGADQFDYFYTIIPVDGTMKVYVSGTNTGAAAGYLYMYGYDRRRANGQIFGEYIAGTSTAAGATIRDTLTVYGRAADTFYFRVQSVGAFSYSFSYDMVDLTTNDVEPNNTFEQPVPIAHLEVKSGHIDYISNGTTDAFDYYRTILPSDGTMKIYVNGTNRSSAAGYMYMYGYDRRQGNGQVLGEYIAGTSIAQGASMRDTLTVYGRAADTFYFRIQSVGAFSYSFSYDMVDLTTNDVEPNNTFEQPVPIAHLEVKSGHIDYISNGTTDAFDYYRTILPSDGTMKIYVNGTNRSSAAGYMYMYGYDRRQGNGQVLGEYIAGTSIAQGASMRDTLTVYGRAADTFYFRVQSVGAFNYSFSYQMVDTSQNDIEPNNTFEQAIPIAHLEQKSGHIDYLSNGTSDGFDYYRAIAPSDGTMMVYVQATNRSGAAGYLYMYGYDRRKGSGQMFGEYIVGTSTPAGATIADTIIQQCVAADTFYFRVQSVGAFSYRISYEVTLGSDTLVRICPGYTRSIIGLYNTRPFSTVKYENMANPGPAIDAANVGGGIYRLTVYNGIECTRDTAIITVDLYPKPNLGADTTVRKCIGSTVDIRNAKATTGYALVEWSTANPASVEVGTYTLIVTNEFGCKDTAIITVANYPQPVAAFTVNMAQQCLTGNSYTFTNTSTISTGALTAVWNFGDNGTANTLSATHVYTVAGTYNVKLIVASANGCRDSVVQTVTVQPMPSLGPDQAVTVNCIGGTANISTLYTTTGFTTAVYSTSTPAIAPAGVYTLIVTNASGCRDTANITVQPSPIVTMPASGADSRLANRECTDAQGWTHYYNNNATPANFTDDILLLSLRKNTNNIGTVGDGTFQLRTATTGGAGSNTGVSVTNPLVQNATGFWAFNRYWLVTPTSQPTSPVGVRFYYNSQDLADVNGSNPAHTHQQLVFYNLVGGNPDPTTNLAGTQDIIGLLNGSQPGSATWTYNQVNANTHYAEFEVNQFTGGGAGVTGNNQTLPLNLVSFSARLRNGNVDLDWKTSLEINTDHFKIQRSADGTIFNTVGQVAAGSSAYTFSDRNVSAPGSGTLFYRLEITDKDGKVYYSSIEMVSFNGSGTFSISPNPATSFVLVKGNNIQQVRLTDNAGRIVLIENVNNQPVHSLQIGHLAKGWYMITIKDKEGAAQTRKLIIQ